MIGVFEAGKHGRWIRTWSREAAELCGDGAEIEFRDVLLFAQKMMLEPELVEFHRFHIDAEASEGVEVAVPDARPVDEFDRELERALCVAKEIVLVDAEKLVECEDRWDGRFADAHDPDLLGFDQRDRREPVSKQTRQRGRAHPAGGASANDHDAADLLVVHCTGPLFAAQYFRMKSACVGMESAPCRTVERMRWSCVFNCSVSKLSASGS